MNATDVIRRLHEHRMWTNQRLRESVTGLTDHHLRQEMSIGQGSVWHTLTHLMGAEYVWLEALRGNEEPTMPGDVANKLPGNQQGADPIPSLHDLVQRWETLDGRWREYLDMLTESSLDETVYKVSLSSRLGEKTGTSRCDVLLHVCTHAQYTTAQLVNMLRQLEQSPLPDGMLITMARSGL